MVKIKVYEVELDAGFSRYNDRYENSIFEAMKRHKTDKFKFIHDNNIPVKLHTFVDAPRFKVIFSLIADFESDFLLAEWMISF